MSDKSLYHQCLPLIHGRCLLFLRQRCKARSHHVPFPRSAQDMTLPDGLGERAGTWQANGEENTPAFGLFRQKNPNKTSQPPTAAMWMQTGSLAEDAQLRRLAGGHPHEQTSLGSWRASPILPCILQPW